MCFYDIATKYHEPLEAAHKHNDDDRHDVLLECGAGAAGRPKPKLDLSEEL